MSQPNPVDNAGILRHIFKVWHQQMVIFGSVGNTLCAGCLAQLAPPMAEGPDGFLRHAQCALPCITCGGPRYLRRTGFGCPACVDIQVHWTNLSLFFGGACTRANVGIAGARRHWLKLEASINNVELVHGSGIPANDFGNLFKVESIADIVKEISEANAFGFGAKRFPRLFFDPDNMGRALVSEFWGKWHRWLHDVCHRARYVALKWNVLRTAMLHLGVATDIIGGRRLWNHGQGIVRQRHGRGLFFRLIAVRMHAVQQPASEVARKEAEKWVLSPGLVVENDSVARRFALIEISDGEEY